MSHNPQDILDTILGRLRSLASTETVVGEPLTVGDVTILPVIKISVGFAAGGGEGSKEDDKPGHGAGGGGGGGATVSPVGFITYDGEKIKFVGVSKGRIDSLVESVPDLLKKLGITRKDGKEKAEKESKEEHERDTDKAK